MGHLGSGTRMRDKKYPVRSQCPEQEDLRGKGRSPGQAVGATDFPQVRLGGDGWSMKLERQAEAKLQKSLDTKP